MTIGLESSVPVSAALGVSTGIGGVVCIAAVVGVGSLLGSSAGGAFGEGAGEILYERTQP